MRPPYPVEIVPLLPEFLLRRRAKLTFLLRLSEQLGLDRPALVTAVNLSTYRLGDEGAMNDDLRSPYATSHDQRILPALVAAEGAGLLVRQGERWCATDRGREVAAEVRRQAIDHYGTLRPLPADELADLADLLESAFQAAARAPQPARREHTEWAWRYRSAAPAVHDLARLDDAVFGLWQVRDDCHMAAWRATGIDGPALDVLTRIWREEVRTTEDLEARLPHQGPAEVRSAVGRLRDEGRVERDGDLRVSAEGRAFREGIEAETDRLFFEPWPESVGSRGSWIAERLGMVNAQLA